MVVAWTAILEATGGEQNPSRSPFRKGRYRGISSSQGSESCADPEFEKLLVLRQPKSASCHSEPFRTAQDKLREESQRCNEILRRSAPQNDILPKQG